MAVDGVHVLWASLAGFTQFLSTISANNNRGNTGRNNWRRKGGYNIDYWFWLTIEIISRRYFGITIIGAITNSLPGIIPITSPIPEIAAQARTNSFCIISIKVPSVSF